MRNFRSYAFCGKAYMRTYAQVLFLSLCMGAASMLAHAGAGETDKSIGGDILFPEKIIKGKITDENGAPVAGASVKLKGSASVGTSTDEDGEFSIQVPDNGAVLELSSVGYKSMEISVTASGLMQVVLKSEVKVGEEVVVIGYGTTQKRNTTGAISSIKTKDISTGSNTNILQALAGRSPGVQAIQSSGQPGASVSIQLRSNPSNASSGTLFIVDGVIINNASGDPGLDSRYGGGGVDRSPLNFINPNDIETIEFIKDASAASIYGARAGAGVVFITTKKGKAGQARVDYSASFGFQKAKNFYETFNTKEYMMFRNDLQRESWRAKHGVAPYGSFTEAEIDQRGLTDPAYRYIAKYTQNEINNAVDRNPIDSILQPGHFFQHNLSISGGTDKLRYAISGNIVDNEGVIIRSNYKRVGGRANITSEISKKVRVGLNVVYSNAKSDNANVSKGQYENAGLILSAMYHPPTLPLTDGGGNYPLNPEYSNNPNPLSFLTVTDLSLETRLLSSGYVEVEPVKNLVYKLSGSYDNSNTRRNVYMPRTFLYGLNNNGYAKVGDGGSATYQVEHTLNYRKDVGDHSASMLAGYSYNNTKYSWVGASTTNHITDNFLYDNLQGGTNILTPYSGRSEDEWASYFGRIMYDFKDRYLLSASIRRDGASRFAANKKWGTFSSVSAGWIVSDETFLSQVKWVNFLKLRASYGTTGNSSIGASAFSFYNTGSNWAFGINPTQSIGVYYSQLANPNLTWEKVAEVNLGVDFSLLNNRLTGSADVFNKTISGLLDSDPLATDFIVSSVASNAGKTRSKGWEIGLKSRNIVSNSNGFEWETELNLSHYENNWVKRSPAKLAVLEKYQKETDPFSAIYTYVNDGIYTGGAKPVHQPSIQLGQVLLRDINGYDANNELIGRPDGKLNQADRVLLGTYDPTLNFGISNTFRYKNFDLSIYMYGLKRKRYNDDVASFWDPSILTFGWNKLKIFSTGWTSYNTSSTRPSPLGVGSDGSGDYWLEDATFLRCRDIMLGYTLPASLLQRQNIVKRLRFSINVQNAFILTRYTGFDPELDSFLSYPNPFGVVVGVNVGF